MFFTRSAHIFAFLALVFGVVQLAVAIAIMTGFISPQGAKLALVLLAARSNGEVFITGFNSVLVALALGTLSEVVLAIRRSHDYRSTLGDKDEGGRTNASPQVSKELP